MSLIGLFSGFGCPVMVHENRGELSGPLAHMRFMTNRRFQPRSRPTLSQPDPTDRRTVFGAVTSGCHPTQTWSAPYNLIHLREEARLDIESKVASVPLPLLGELLNAAVEAYVEGRGEEIVSIAVRLARAEWGQPVSGWLRARLSTDLKAYAALCTAPMH
jgi:hypothetical protein